MRERTGRTAAAGRKDTATWGGAAATWAGIAIAALGATAAMIFNACSVRSTNRQIGVAEQGQITDRYAKAVEQLGASVIDVRLGGIYALERVMRDSSGDQPAVMEVLSAFIRDNVGKRPSPSSTRDRVRQRPETDVMAAFSVLGRNPHHDAEHSMDLSGANLTFLTLARVTMDRADLSGADLTGADLSGAHLTGANLTGATLVGTQFNGAWIDRALLVDATLDGAHLAGAHLSYANLGQAKAQQIVATGADLTSANLAGADLTGSDLTGTHLMEAKLNGTTLISATLASAKLSGADLTGAHFNCVDLMDADTSDAIGYREECQPGTMPTSRPS